MKTVYIPAGATYNYETLVTDDVIVHGHLHVTNGLKAKHISGRGFITAGEISADIVDVTELECGTVICRRLLARSIAKKIEDTLDYPGQIKVNVIRESRAVEYAK